MQPSHECKVRELRQLTRYCATMSWASRRSARVFCSGKAPELVEGALAGTIYGLYKAEVIHGRGHGAASRPSNYATIEKVDWFNHCRLLEPNGNIPPAEAERQSYAAAENIDMQCDLQTKVAVLSV